ncbi:UNVERIFIED_CONTAM: hypothetical protein GTU68_060436, partial [Idotea baltica]|nr:hypothetical protein [Idotea baltica]
MNTCYNCVDRHVESGRGEQAAIIYDSPITETKEIITYEQLQSRVAGFAGVLRGLDVGVGDRVIIYMPMTPDAVVAMLACARLGAIHSVVFGGFAASELAVRIDDCTPKVIVSASCGIEPNRVVAYKPLLDGAIEMASHKVQATVIKQRPQAVASMIEGRDHDWDTATAGAQPADPVPLGGADPLYILYTSGTTGQPKGVVRAAGGHAVALQWTMKNIYDTEAGEVFWAASDVGWVVGHSYIVYAPLLAGCTTVLFEGKPVGTPDAGTFWRVISEHGVGVMFTAPTALRAIKRVDPEGKFVKKYDMSGFRTLFLAGERADPPTVEWAREKLNVPVIDHWWQTETGWTITGNPAGLDMLEVPSGSAGAPMPGYDIRILDEGGNEVPDGTLGAICVKLPMPPASLPTVWNADDRYISSYLNAYPGYYETGDAGMKDEAGFLYI